VESRCADGERFGTLELSGRAADVVDIVVVDDQLDDDEWRCEHEQRLSPANRVVVVCQRWRVVVVIICAARAVCR
jgi:hypothetical protein